MNAALPQGFLAETDELIFEIWDKVQGTVQDLIRQDANWGFSKIVFVENPSLLQLINAAEMLESFIDSVLKHRLGEQYDETRRLLNCKNQVVNIQSVAAAALAGNQEDYDLFLSRLKSQANC